MSHLRGRHVWLVAAGLVIGLTGTFLWPGIGASMSPCEHEVRFGDMKRGAEMCRESFRETGNEDDLYWAAKAYMNLGKTTEADGLARRLLSGPRAGHALGILSYLALVQGQHLEARMQAAIALYLHTIVRDDAGRVGDMHLLSLAALGHGEYRAALTIASDAVRLAQRLGDAHTEVSVSLALADVLRRLGDLPAATGVLASTVKRATSPCDRAWALFKSGQAQMALEQDGWALSDFADATEANQHCKTRNISDAVIINEAWLLRGTEPSRALAKLDDLARSSDERTETMLLRGYIAADRGQLADAEHYLAEAARLGPSDADWEWEVECAHAELAALRGGLFGDLLAELYYLRAISLIEKLRMHARAQSAYFVSSHRRPFDGLIALLARQRRWRDVLDVVLGLDASDMLRATAREMQAQSVSDDPVPQDTTSAAAAPTTVDDVLAAWRDRDLIIVIAPSQPQIGAGREHAYRLWVSSGQVTGADVGSATTARKHANDLFADPGDRAAARALGRVFIPPEAPRGALDVLAIGVLGKVPITALRDESGSLVIRKHPLTRVLALRANGAESRGGGHPVVIANPTGDLPYALWEGTVVVKALGAGAQACGVGLACSATRSRLWEARGADLLHVAGHVYSRGHLRALRLADGDVDRTEIVQWGIAPRIAVLAGCGSAAATDEEGWGSIAAALLESGTSVVVATDRNVGDAASLSLIRRFYEQPDWRADPASALARVQDRLDAEAATSTDKATTAQPWAAFSVLRRPPVVPRLPQ